MIAIRAGVGRIITGRPTSELAQGVAGEDGCCDGGGGVDGGVDGCTDMNVCTGDEVDVRCFWLVRQDLVWAEDVVATAHRQ